MGFRFRRSFSIIPGVRINLSKGGISTSLGRRGATINIGKRGMRGTVGLPGTGLSYSDMIFRRGSRAAPESADQIDGPALPRRSGKSLLIGGVVLILIVAGLLFAAGLMSARQSTDTVTGQSVVMSTKDEKSGSSAPAANRATRRTAACRSDPNLRARVVSELPAGQAVSVLEEQAGWSRVSAGDLDCWVRSSLVR